MSPNVPIAIRVFFPVDADADLEVVYRLIDREVGHVEVERIGVRAARYFQDRLVVMRRGIVTR